MSILVGPHGPITQDHEAELASLAAEIRSDVAALTPKLLRAQELCRESGRSFRDWLAAEGIARASAYRALAESRDPALANQRRAKDREAKKIAKASVSDLGHSPAAPALPVDGEADGQDEPPSPVPVDPPRPMQAPAAAAPVDGDPSSAAGPPVGEDGLTDAEREEVYAASDREYHDAIMRVMEADDAMSAAHLAIKRQAMQIAALAAQIEGMRASHNAAVQIVRDRDSTIRRMRRKLDAQDAELRELRERTEAPPGSYNNGRKEERTEAAGDAYARSKGRH